MSEEGPRQAEDWVSQLQLRAAKQLEETQRMQAELEKLSITSTNSDKSVTVSIDASGIMTDLKLTEAVKNSSAADLAAEILAMQHKAQNQLGKAASQVVKDSVGLETATGEAVMNGYRKRFSKKAMEAREEARKKGDKS
ncbi:YbaB/EbfC family nucleoid-associated protein [Stackebrandtia nassauensis]|uniref:YbaB/EbfC DNA-binding family protein n=1 Tax=Stackebrandtia nassauensis (strain DSM 44728 / CIP 108903 / NRRL B-16338 / NBRC 102104 / LLR-40K-21) TaxID=446470 RepID=D3PXW2_STANL|nr:YbaB/EbfC family nucleoid-associated protein [Stackebrandtia nassauensis]ADD45291.1 hypothetical protein Snas_5661 [Stackebrandtia nassauensis DSM 44728]